MRKLIKLSVRGLLGRFDHEVDFPEDWEFVILHGPNGVGKTKLLELINAILKGDLFKVASLPFASATFVFHDGAVLNVERTPAQMALDMGETVVADEFGLMVRVTGEDGKEDSWEMPITDSHEMDRAVRILVREAPVVQTGPRTFHDQLEEDDISLSELVSRYGSTLSPKAHALWSGYLFPPEKGKGGYIAKFIKEFQVHFIETQRLLTEIVRPRPDMTFASRQTRQFETRSMVLRLAEDLTFRIREALAENSRISQQLDKDFPRRILLEEGDFPEEVTEEMIQDKYSEQTKLRQRLADISLLDNFVDLPLPQRDLAEFERRVLWTYLRDSEQKLQSFIPLLDRITVLTEIVTPRFLFKDLLIDRGRGFRFVSDNGMEISPELLSSGEQHELVLAYELLFKAERDSLVLIDEPEISLHAAWQKAFLGDIIRISQISSLRFIIATHSPQIINKWWSRAVALHPGLDEEDQ